MGGLYAGSALTIVWSITVVVVVISLKLTDASNGDRSYIFNKCLEKCLVENCTHLYKFSESQSVHLKLLQWSCSDECKYDCMWITVDAYHRDASAVPQFYGKWPFVRLLGIQEPASMIFSLLNAVTHLAIFQYRAKVPSSSPMFLVWHGMAVVGIATWLCATVFHTRDTPLTEKMDYFSAFGLVLYNLFTLVCRVVGTNRFFELFVIGGVLMAVYGYHIHYLAFVHFDYGYNMLVNVAFGAINAVGWIGWCVYFRKQKPYVWKCGTVMFGLNALLMLELGDFPPLLWAFDAHAIWHAGTVILNLLWYSFIIDDALHESIVEEQKGQSEHKKMV